MRQKHLRLYNVMFPLWLLVWFPSWLWLLLIPVNALIDGLVLWRALPSGLDRGSFCEKNLWKVILAGFLADFAGSLLLLGTYLLADASAAPGASDFVYALGFQPFRHAGALAVTAAAVILAGAILYLLDRRILRLAGLDTAAAGRAALWLAVVTAPYLFLLPSGLLYR